MTLLRGLALTGLVVVAVVLQTAVLGQVAVDGVAPDVALVLVIAAALVRGPEFGAWVGFLAGVLVDLAPPADHLVGRWALAFVVVGFLAGRLGRRPRRRSERCWRWPPAPSSAPRSSR